MSELSPTPPNSQSPRWRSRRQRDRDRPRQQEHHQPGAGARGAWRAATRPCTLTGALQSEDTEVMIDCLRRLGSGSRPTGTAKCRIGQQRHPGRIIPRGTADLFVANSGTTMRFLTAMVSLGKGAIGSTASRGCGSGRSRICSTRCGNSVSMPRSETGNGCPPVVIESRRAGRAARSDVRADVSSQFLSGLMMAAPFARRTTTIRDRRRRSCPSRTSR